MLVLVLNTGSSTVKFSLIETATEKARLEGTLDFEEHHFQRPADAVKAVLQTPALVAERKAITAVGHRVVHGGSRYVQSQRITPEVKAGIRALAELAPLHNPVSLEGIEAAQEAWPDLPHVAVFDTAFHATLPPAAFTYALPHTWITDWRLRRYGFHGLSFAYCSRRAVEMLGRGPAGTRLVVCHLGNGCSLAAVRDGASIDTTMGFTPLDGLVMGTRSGSVDPGLLLHVQRRHGVSAEDMDRLLNHESGLLGVSGLASDMRRIEQEAASGHAGARLAREVFVHRLRQLIGAMAASLGGVDALVFTAGIGEHSATLRAETCRGLGFLGVELDASANAGCRPDADVATAASRARILVIATREDLTVVREAMRVLGQG
jgi:acetate kinase